MILLCKIIIAVAVFTVIAVRSYISIFGGLNMDLETIVLLIGGVLLAIWLTAIIVMVWVTLGTDYGQDDYLGKD